jgi:hypothetical protein
MAPLRKVKEANGMATTTVSGDYPLDRESLEKAALLNVCSCLYYELADNIAECSDSELQSYVDGTYDCDYCDHNRRLGDK